jgi:hypothetical protein
VCQDKLAVELFKERKNKFLKVSKKVKIRSGILEKEETNLFYSSKIRFFPIWKILLQQKLVASNSKVRQRFILSHYSIKTFIDPKKLLFIYRYDVYLYKKFFTSNMHLFKTSVPG